jgi:hypothetical protein
MNSDKAINSDKEKESSDAMRSQDGYASEMPRDPDAHLSAEEKAEVVGTGLRARRFHHSLLALEAYVAST